jgi:hypothetical protein
MSCPWLRRPARQSGGPREYSFEVPADHPCRSGQPMPRLLGGGMHGVFRSLHVARMDRNSHRSGGIDGNIVLGAGCSAGRYGDSGEATPMGSDRKPAAQAPLKGVQH